MFASSPDRRLAQTNLLAILLHLIGLLREHAEDELSLLEPLKRGRSDAVRAGGTEEGESSYCNTFSPLLSISLLFHWVEHRTQTVKALSGASAGFGQSRNMKYLQARDAQIGK